MAGSPPFAQRLPYGGQCFQILMYIFCADNDFGGILQCRNTLQLRQAKAVGMFVGQDEKLIVRTLLNGMRQAAFKFFAKDYFLFTHEKIADL